MKKKINSTTVKEIFLLRACKTHIFSMHKFAQFIICKAFSMNKLNHNWPKFRECQLSIWDHVFSSNCINTRISLISFFLHASSFRQSPGCHFHLMIKCHAVFHFSIACMFQAIFCTNFNSYHIIHYGGINRERERERESFHWHKIYVSISFSIGISGNIIET